MGDLDSQKLVWLRKAEKTKAKGKGAKVKILFVGRNGECPKKVLQSCPRDIKKRIQSGSSVESWSTSTLQYWVIQSQFVDRGQHYGLFTPSPYAMARDLVGTSLRKIVDQNPHSVSLECIGTSLGEVTGAIVGMELGEYRFKNQWPQKKASGFQVQIKTGLANEKEIKEKAFALGEGTNLARFLVDLPPNLLNPKTYSELLKKHFSKSGAKLAVWDFKRLQKEKMGLHIAVGQGAVEKPCLVHISYRNGGKADPIAFVGKGITFDAGGLDIKPASGMRLMKKDMGGSAAVVGLAHFVSSAKLKINCDFYLAIAENAVDAESFRPGDVITSRSGKTVEIHNTDAEGRLVMADALTLAAEKKPQYLVDVSTLTGAIKVGLGIHTPGLFSNHDLLAETLVQSAQNRGDLCWRMPLVPNEKARLKSEVADMVNCTDGFGGAVTAALFLESFVDDVPWAHFDIYAWNDRAQGPFAHRGGTGQMVQALSDFVEQQQTR
ncbi:MAG: leucyl aminopeptidase family protein [Pseudomonadota bacterium]